MFVIFICKMLHPEVIEIIHVSTPSLTAIEYAAGAVSHKLVSFDNTCYSGRDASLLP